MPVSVRFAGKEKSCARHVFRDNVMHINDFKSQSSMNVKNGLFDNVWQCARCGAQSLLGPFPLSGCPASNGGSHYWRKVS